MPHFSQSGDLVCNSCGRPIEQGMSRRGDALARCENQDCKDANTYEVGSLNHNPAPEIRQMPVNYSFAQRYIWGEPNWRVKDGEKIEQ